ncbi:unnamed protein product [Caenorhabditis brenneri]
MRTPEQPKDCPLCMDPAHTIDSCPIPNKFQHAQEGGRCLICLKIKSYQNRQCRGLKSSDKLCDKMECDYSGHINHKAICPVANTPPIDTLAIAPIALATKKTLWQLRKHQKIESLSCSL